MREVVWDPVQERPGNAEALEAEVRRVAPAAQVKITLVDGQWRVRALAPAAMCGRGHDLSGRDVSAAIAEALTDAGFEATPLR